MVSLTVFERKCSTSLHGLIPKSTGQKSHYSHTVGAMNAGAHLAWKKGSVTEGQLLISLFSIKLHFLLRLENDR